MSYGTIRRKAYQKENFETMNPRKEALQELAKILALAILELPITEISVKLESESNAG